MMLVFFVSAILLFGSYTIAPVSASSGLFLTPYILKNESAIARNLSNVNSALFLNVTSYSGFLTVDEVHNSNLFFWYFPVQNKPVETTPWIIWLQGGPGATSLAGLFVEIGPFAYDNGLKLREWSWAKNYSLLFIDSPVGAGYSFTNSPDGFVQNMDECSEHLYSALQQLLQLFPELQSAPLYLAGESYAGHFVPAFAHRIHHAQPSNLKLKDSSVILKGIMLGNPVIDRRDEVNLTAVYYHWGLLDLQGVREMGPLQDKYAKAIKENNDEEALMVRNDLLDELDTRTFQAQTYNVLKDEIFVNAFASFVANPDVRDAIHAGSIEFTFSNATVHTKLSKDFLVSLTPKVEELLEHYRVMIYCGQLDLTAPCVTNAAARRRSWQWSGRKSFLEAPRDPWWHNHALAGYVKSGGNFTEVLVRGAGHLVPMDKPSEAFQLVSYFIRGLDLPLPTNFVRNEETSASIDDMDTGRAGIRPNNGLIASIALNVIFVAVIVIGAIYWIRWKRRTDTYFYSMVDNASLSDAVLTMD